ncbi:MAG TPA: DUF2760 domain-containing protein [Terriglobia bacterium]|nr:DUF2760 domain-containing protein [Terriglobia bacterium]
MAQTIRFLDRLKLAWRILLHGAFAADVVDGLRDLEAKRARASAPPERVNAAALVLLAALQREGRFIDFIRQDVAGFSDEDIGAAGRVVHAGCRKVLDQLFAFEPAAKGAEGGPMTIPAGFDAQRIRLAGNVTGQPPFRGVLKHHGWVVTAVRMPEISEALDPRVVAPAEVELP